MLCWKFCSVKPLYPGPPNVIHLHLWNMSCASLAPKALEMKNLAQPATLNPSLHLFDLCGRLQRKPFAVFNWVRGRSSCKSSDTKSYCIILTRLPSQPCTLLSHAKNELLLALSQRWNNKLLLTPSQRWNNKHLLALPQRWKTKLLLAPSQRWINKHLLALPQRWKTKL